MASDESLGGVEIRRAGGIPPRPQHLLAGSGEGKEIGARVPSLTKALQGVPSIQEGEHHERSRW